MPCDGALHAAGLSMRSTSIRQNIPRGLLRGSSIFFMWRSVKKMGQLEIEQDDGTQINVRIKCDLRVNNKSIRDWISHVKRLNALEWTNY